MFIKQMWPGYIAIGIHVLTGALVHFEPEWLEIAVDWIDEPGELDP